MQFNALMCENVHFARMHLHSQHSQLPNNDNNNCLNGRGDISTAHSRNID